MDLTTHGTHATMMKYAVDSVTAAKACLILDGVMIITFQTVTSMISAVSTKTAAKCLGALETIALNTIATMTKLAVITATVAQECLI